MIFITSKYLFKEVAQHNWLLVLRLTITLGIQLLPFWWILFFHWSDCSLFFSGKKNSGKISSNAEEVFKAYHWTSMELKDDWFVQKTSDKFKNSMYLVKLYWEKSIWLYYLVVSMNSLQRTVSFIREFSFLHLQIHPKPGLFWAYVSPFVEDSVTRNHGAEEATELIYNFNQLVL